ncbi:unnamed protein product [Camellia sinensis]
MRLVYAIKMSSYTLDMFKVPVHQVAGHQAIGGKLGPLVDDDGRFYKPLQSGERGSTEKAFYTSFSSNTSIPEDIRRFFPVFHGTQVLEASDGSGPCPHLVLQDIVSGHLSPSIMDIKMGANTWPPQSPEDYITRCLEKDRETTSINLGFRIEGFHIYRSEESDLWKPEKQFIKSFSAQDVRLVLKKFVSSNASPDLDLNPDCAFASIVYGGSTGILAQLRELKAWFEVQTIYRFYSCSVLMMHGKGGSGAAVKLVDFAHVVDGEGVIDHNFLGGLCSLIEFISKATQDEYPNKTCLKDSENNRSSSDNCTCE